MIQYFKFVIQNSRLLIFGFVLMFFSSFGQTFFISLFSEQIRDEFNLTHGNFGLIYSIATLASGLTLIWAGQKIDNFDLRKFTFFVFAGLILALIVFATSPFSILLYPAIYLTRLFGQGLMTHTSMITMTRYFEKNRGKAISIASLGLPTGETIFPILVVLIISSFGWRITWIICAIILLFILPITLLILLKNFNKIHSIWIEKKPLVSSVSKKNELKKEFTRKDVLNDSTFYLIIPAIVSPAFIMTGLFFHQIHIALSKGWSITFLAGTFVLYAISTVTFSILGGILIDKLSAIRIFPLYLPPLGIAVFFLGTSDHYLIAIPYMVLAGATIGIGNPMTNAIWAEIYGTKHIGSIKALVMASMVSAGALSPFIFGWLIDQNISVEKIALSCIAYIFLSQIIAQRTLRKQFSEKKIL